MKSLFDERDDTEDVQTFQYVPLKTSFQKVDEQKQREDMRKNMIRQREETEALCRKMIEDAKKRADEIMERRSKDSERLCREAVEEAKKTFFLEAEKALMAEKQHMRETFDADTKEIFSDLAALKEKLVHRYLNELKDVSVAVGEKIVGIALSSSSDVIEKMILQEVEKEHHLDYIRIYIDQMSYSAIVQADSELMENLTEISDNVKFVVAENKPQGHCIIETPEEITDVSVETQMRNIKERLKNIRM